MHRTLAISAAVTLVAAASWASCGAGEDPFCGDGHLDPGEQCDDGNTDNSDFCLNNCIRRAVPQLTVKWEFNKDVTEGFTGDNCTDLGIRTVDVEIVGSGGTFVATESCSFRQVVFSDIPPDMYNVRLSALDIDGALLTEDVPKRRYEFLGGTQEEFVFNVDPDEWKSSYDGTFFFRLRWGGQDCAAANPPVAEHVLRLERDGVPVGATTTDGDPLDGSAPGSCRSLTEMFPHSALTVPFGFATFTVEGLDGAGQSQFQGTFDTFVGAGVSNPEIEFDVNSLTPDAGIPDAGAPDGS